MNMSRGVREESKMPGPFHCNGQSVLMFSAGSRLAPRVNLASIVYMVPYFTLALFLVVAFLILAIFN